MNWPQISQVSDELATKFHAEFAELFAKFAKLFEDAEWDLIAFDPRMRVTGRVR